jgi:hypothetical protein
MRNIFLIEADFHPLSTDVRKKDLQDGRGKHGYGSQSVLIPTLIS